MRISAGRTAVAVMLAASSAICAAQDAASTIPAIPAAVPVTLDHQTTTLLVLDFNTAVCQPNPACTAMMPAIAAFADKARAAGVPVVYSTTVNPAGNPPTLAAVAPKAGEPLVAARADKFIDSNLEDLLKERKAQTLVIVGTAANGAVLYTAFHANVRGFTVVVAEDGIVSAAPVATTLTRYQLLNQPGFANTANKPLAPRMVTLSRTNLITWR